MILNQPRSLSFVCLAVLFLFSGFCPAQDYYSSDESDSAKQAFEKGNYPWYDADADAANFEPDVLVSGGAKTADRQSVRKAAAVKPTGRTGASWGWLSFWVVLILILFVGLVALAIWFLLKMDPPSGFAGRMETPEDDGVFGSDRVESLPFDLTKQSGDFRGAAEAAYRAGDFKNAVTYLFSHVLLTLDQYKRVRLRRGKTNRQYMNEMNANGAESLTAYYERLMISFESTFFGNHELQAAQFEESWHGLSDFQSRLQQLDGVTHG